ncbi:DUF354 domain-containing protein [Halobacterium zhouii]|uniref:DUF354 domain-containing protein n=1 Tax=Halobacterium zhouii TaxID=2902624 RepID=UPI001E45FE64|nr:DUF354 domain-containing protein [Halobacterium zhouii]
MTAASTRYLVFTNTPAHVHLYKNMVAELRDEGHDVLVLGRAYGCTEDLLSYYDMPYELYGGQSPSFRSLVTNVPSQFTSILRRVRAYDPDVVFGRGSYAAFAGTVSRTRTILVVDSTPYNVGPIVSSAFVHRVLTPDSYGRNLGANHDRFRGVKECAYLHPDVFSPDQSVRADLGVGSSEPYVVVRLNAYDSVHDVGLGAGPTTDRVALLERLAEHATVFVSDESETLDLSTLDARRFDLHPARIHDALAAANLVVTDTGTIATEGALLGTPAIRFIDEDEPAMGEFEELEANDLLVQHTDLADVLADAQSILESESERERWQRRRDEFMASKPNLTRRLLDIAVDAAPQ